MARRAEAFLLCAVLVLSLFSGCGSLSFEAKYDANPSASSFNVLYGESGDRAEMFAAALCVIDAEDLLGDGSAQIEEATSAVLFDMNAREVVYAKNAHQRMAPASLTKLMTALVALQNSSTDQVLTATERTPVTDAGATVLGLKAGDTMTLDQALRILLLRSANDVANLIAENIGGSIEGFVGMMNEEAALLGATNTHFANPNGLTDEEHYTTAYDLYLIFNQAIKYQQILEIIAMSSYDGVYHNAAGGEVSVSVSNTNGYVSGSRSTPANVTVVGGKTGTTNAAGHCLILLAKDAGGNPFIAVVLHAETADSLYGDMDSLLGMLGEENAE